MFDKVPKHVVADLLYDLHPLAEQAARIFQYLSDFPTSISQSDVELAARIGNVSAQHVALVARSLVRTGLATSEGHSLKLAATSEHLSRLASNFEGLSIYQRVDKDADTVRVVLTEPGDRSRLRDEINRKGLPPRLFQTRDAFLNLAHSARAALTVVTPFIDNAGSDFLVDLYSAAQNAPERHLICRPLTEEHCGEGFRHRREDFRRLKVSVYEYALPSALPSGRETFHAKVVLVDDCAYYVGSSNFMASALDRSLECGVIVHGESARELKRVVDSLKAISTISDPGSW